MKYTLALSVFISLAWAAPAPQSDPPATKADLIDTCCQDTDVLVNCIQIWPESCFCENDWILRCETQQGQSCPSHFFTPFYQDCTIEARAEVPVVPETFEELLEQCDCDEQPICIQSWPESCFCRNDGIEKCESKGVCPPVFFKPFYGDCSVEKRRASDNPIYQRCGSRGLDPCPQDQICISDPFREPGDCGIACDRPGYCIPDQMCGGFAGFACPAAGQECVDDERDDCDPLGFDSDCAGLCFFPQP